MLIIFQIHPSPTFYSIEEEWHLLLNWVIIGLDNGLSPIQQQLITQRNDDLLLSKFLEI